MGGMDWKRPLVVLVAFGIIVWAVGAAVTLLTHTVAEDSGVVMPAVVTLFVVGVAVGVMVAVGRRSARWITNPPSYW